MSEHTVSHEPQIVHIPEAGEGVECRLVPDWPAYAAGDDGSVWSRHNNKWGFSRTWRRLKTPIAGTGYPVVNLSEARDPGEPRRQGKQASECCAN